LKKLNLGVLAIAMLLANVSLATTYYIDNTRGNDINNGTSVYTPWKSISKVNSFTFQDGDSILFKRGDTWKETLSVNQSGKSSSPILYGSYGEGSLPRIDGGYSRPHGIYLDSRRYVIIEDFFIRNTTHGAVRIQRSEYITVRESEMYIYGRAGVFIEESANCLITNNVMTTPSTYHDVQTDGIYAQRNSNNIYDGNHIVISNQHPAQHCDAIQFFLETSATISNNYIEQNNSKSGNAQGIYCSQNSGTFRIYNNIGYGMHTTSGLIKFNNSGQSSGRAEIIGNTVYGGKGGLIQIDDPYIIFKNNIIVSTGTNPVVVFSKSLKNKSNIDYNLYKNSSTGSSLIIEKSTAYNITEWQSDGYGENSIEGDPEFVSTTLNNFSLQYTSPALENGVDLEAPYNVDRNGTSRPSGGKTDIGAYERIISDEIDDSGLRKNFDGSETLNNIPEFFELAQNYPNPFNPATTIKYSLPENSMVTLKVYDITGSEVAVLINDIQSAGFHQVKFDASNLASGTYIYMLTTKDLKETKKMVLIK
jgi:hypothetical protein